VIGAVRSLRAAEFKVGVVTQRPPSQWAKFEAAGIEDEFYAVCVSSVIAHASRSAIFEEAAKSVNFRLPLDDRRFARS